MAGVDSQRPNPLNYSDLSLTVHLPRGGHACSQGGASRGFCHLRTSQVKQEKTQPWAFWG